MKPPPPIPHDCGRAALRANTIEAAASTALPPRSSTARPTSEAAGDSVATMPPGLRVAGRYIDPSLALATATASSAHSAATTIPRFIDHTLPRIFDREDRPRLGHALEGVRARVAEAQPGADDERRDRARDEHLVGAGQGGDARGDVDGQAADVVLPALDLAGVQAGAHAEAAGGQGVADPHGAADRARRAVEGGQCPVAERLDPAPAEALDVAARDLVVGVEQRPPRPVTDLRGALCR